MLLAIREQKTQSEVNVRIYKILKCSCLLTLQKCGSIQNILVRLDCKNPFLNS